MQRNWIGRSTGADVQFVIEGRDEPVTVYTTRPDTLYGATFFVVAADSDLAAELAAGTPAEGGVRRVRGACQGVIRHRAAGDRPPEDRRRSWAGTPSTRSTASGCRSGRRTTCWPTTGTARSWPCPRTTSATWTSHARSACRCGSSSTPAAEAGDPAETGVATAGDGVLVNSGPLDGLSKAEAIARDRGAAGRAGHWQGCRQLPAARLADLAAALLGHADPDRPLPRVRRGAACPTTSCRRAAA